MFFLHYSLSFTGTLGDPAMISKAILKPMGFKSSWDPPVTDVFSHPEATQVLSSVLNSRSWKHK